MGRGSRAQHSANALEMLREAFSPATLRHMLGIVDMGRTLLARVVVPEGGSAAHDVDAQRRDVLVHVVDVLRELPRMARLHVPANILWRRPRPDETLTVLVPADADSPGAPVALYGDGGREQQVPPWFAQGKAGIYTDDTVRVESSAADVELEAPSGQKVKLGAAATKGVNRQDDPILPGTLAFTVAPTSLVITYTPPGGSPQVFTLNLGGSATFAGSPATFTLGGKTGAGSSKVKAED